MKGRSIHRGSLILVDEAHPYRGGAVELSPVRAIVLERRAAAMLALMLDGADDALALRPSVGFRGSAGEHETGLAVDFEWQGLPSSAALGRFRAQAARFGFVLRYPQAKEHCTGVTGDPLHFRFVGVPHAEIMLRFDFVLEEYLGFVKRYRWGEDRFAFAQEGRSFAVSFLGGDSAAAGALPRGALVSGNNVDGWVMTEIPAEEGYHG